MDLLLDLLQGLGLAAAAGIRPFLPVAAVAALAMGDAGIDLDGTDFSFLESPATIAVAALALLASIVARDRLEVAVGAVAIVVGALLCAASLDDRHDAWWYGTVVGAAMATAAGVVARTLFDRVRERFARTNDAAAAAALPFYGEGAALAGAVASIALPPLGLLVAGFVMALGLQQRRRAGQKYAGLRILK